MNRLNDKVALITGAARGIGEGIARAFSQEGATVILSDINHDLGKTVAAEIGASYEPLDVRQESDWQRVTESILQTHGRLDVVVNNAGVTGFEAGLVAHDPEHTSLTDWHAVHAVNLDGTFLGCKYAIRAMRKNGRKTGSGSIINISSRSGIVGISGAAAYASSKAAIRNHTKTVALYCAEQGLTIRCNSIHPAAILTPMWEPLLGDGAERETRMKEFLHDTPLKRFGTVAEVAALAVLLASDEATYMTGTELHIDGGILAGSAAAPSSE